MIKENLQEVGTEVSESSINRKATLRDLSLFYYSLQNIVRPRKQEGQVYTLLKMPYKY